MTETRIDDLQLFRRARSGEFEAFEELVGRYERRVFGLAQRILQHRQDAEDATQLTFVSVLENLDSFREEASVGTWILRIATNHALKLLRKRRTQRNVSPPANEEEPLPHPEFIAQWRENPAEMAQRAEVRQLVADALAQLDEKYRAVFVLRDIQGLSTQEAAELLKITPGNVKVRLLRARLQLRERLTRALGDETNKMFPEHEHR